MKAIVLLSGGVDSTVALAATKQYGIDVDLALSFDYGQTHAARELSAAKTIAKHYSVEHHILNMRNVLDIPSALTRHGVIPETHAEQPDATFVPGRNLVMIAVATAWANGWGYGTVVIGANADDSGGYPDCRSRFLEPLDEATRSAYSVSVWAPLLKMNKRQIVELGMSLGAPLEHTWSCYRGGWTPCQRCGACQSRKDGGL